MMGWGRQCKDDPGTLTALDIARCIQIILDRGAIHVENQEWAEALIQAASEQGHAFVYDHDKDQPIFMHTVRRVSQDKKSSQVT